MLNDTNKTLNLLTNKEFIPARKWTAASSTIH